MLLNESTVEDAALAWFGELRYAVGHGPEFAPGAGPSERESFSGVLLEKRLREAVSRLNPKIPTEAQEDALRKVKLIATPSLVQTNRTFHKMLRDGIEVEYRRPDGSIAGDHVKLIDYAYPGRNDWLVVNQFTVVENGHERRPDIVVYVNGLPLSVVELKNAANEDATIWSAYRQLQTYKAEIPSLLHYNATLVVSDGLEARMGSLTANQEWFKVWRTVSGLEDAPDAALELETLIRGVFDQRRFLTLLEHFILFEEDTDSDRLHKIIAGYHQFHAVNAAVDETIRASGMGQDEGTRGESGDRRAGVVWHTQGSGKSFSMLFYAGRIIRHPVMQNPTLVVLTDRNDLDDQLFGQFQRCHEILGQTPLQADRREELRELLTRNSGGVIFTTIHKFLPETGEDMPALSDRRNIVVIADEAHRSQYGFKVRVNKETGERRIGLAVSMRQALPGATFIGFTGTPIEKTDANTRAVFGDYISVYDIQRAVHDGATVPIYYESRISKLRMNREALPTLDEEFDEITEGQEFTAKEKIKTKWAALEALVGDPKRVELIAQDLVQHFERRTEAMEGKAMIVCMSRRICVDMYNALIKLRPEWASAKDDDVEAERQKDCLARVIMTGSASDGPEWQQHIRTKDKRRKLATRFKDTKDPFRIVIVRDMWLTGFDAPCMHTMYLDKPMQGHGLMQAIARVNRVFKDKPGGLIVDYLGLADQLKRALATYTDSGGTGSPTIDTDRAIGVMREKHEVVCDMMHGFDWSKWTSGTPAERLALLPSGQEHVLQLAEGKARFTQATLELSHAFALCAASEAAGEIRDDVAFFQAISAALNKKTLQGQRSPEEIDAAVRQLVSKAIAPDGDVIDVFSAAGLARPDIGILDDRFLAEVRGLKHKNVAAELLEKLLKDQIKVRAKRNLVQSEQFSDRLQKTLNSYHNRAIATQEVIEELIRLAHDLDAATRRGEELGLTDDEVAFYDALAANGTARDVMGNEKLKVIAAELISKVRKSTTIDWHLKEGARAKIRVLVKRILNKHGYPPDLQAEAVQTVLKQAELLCKDWV
ncbi:type I restriction endonuclease subunit R [Ruficoccus sp. ZRK36]|uniref:type I restriction endonuclease subunit R n=1 Tax=Ruficoccus sp. ZRK36 TaxID=2866311 RepID=UPI001C73B5AE|nr:type I restriction endonuclease subunit R [Ruficoccus sp. ZRK36]QYY36871.1 type I restriction endonuclease subunit R [Ruficoccus sp. ZRK36]